MFSSNPFSELVLAYDRVRDLREEAAAERLRRALGPRCPLAASLRRIADRLDPAPLSRRTASQL